MKQMLKQETKQTEKKEVKQTTKQVYEARVGSPFKQEDAQVIGEFIENCKDKTTRGILSEIKRHPNHAIYSLFEWNKNKAAELYLLQRVREIISHIQVRIISIGSQEPIVCNVPISAFKSVQPLDYSEDKVYVSIGEGISNIDYRKQIIDRAKTELKNWMERYQQYQELSEIIKSLKPFQL